MTFAQSQLDPDELRRRMREGDTDPQIKALLFLERDQRSSILYFVFNSLFSIHSFLFSRINIQSS